MAIPGRFERSTYCLEGSCSIQLSYGTDAIIIADFPKIVKFISQKHPHEVTRRGVIVNRY